MFAEQAVISRQNLSLQFGAYAAFSNADFRGGEID
jgi:hypothetical protein